MQMSLKSAYTTSYEQETKMYFKSICPRIISLNHKNSDRYEQILGSVMQMGFQKTIITTYEYM